MKIALVHDYLTQRGGAERVFELLCQHFPEADIFTSLYDPPNTIDLGDRPVRTTILQNIPGAAPYFRLMAPFYYAAFRVLDLQQYDLVISSTTSFAKAVRQRPGAKHICFCHNVTRFLWDTDTYLKEYGTYRRLAPLLNPIFRWMRSIDRAYAQGPDLYIANSSTVAQRIRATYDQQATVVNYPIDSDRFHFSAQKADYFLVASRLLSYKRVGITIEAFNQLELPLVIIGDGPERRALERQAGANIRFLGYVPDAERAQWMAKAKAVIITALEDYGLVPIEANASGTPVIAYGAGGVLDTQTPGKTAILFDRQSPEALQAAITQAHETAWNYHAIREHALTRFSKPIFFDQVNQIIDSACNASTSKQIDPKNLYGCLKL